MAVTNKDFGARVGCSESMASRVRSGKRLPSPSLLRLIITKCELDAEQAMTAWLAGREGFSEYITKEVFAGSVAA